MIRRYRVRVERPAVLYMEVIVEAESLILAEARIKNLEEFPGDTDGMTDICGRDLRFKRDFANWGLDPSWLQEPLQIGNADEVLEEAYGT